MKKKLGFWLANDGLKKFGLFNHIYKIDWLSEKKSLNFKFYFLEEE
jgi:hypothetical protein